jgi:hypothetical protein
VKAGIATVDQLTSYRFSSYWYLHHPEKRPKFLRPQTALEWAGGMSDTPRGWAEYAQRLELEAMGAIRTSGWQKKERALCRGWAIGSKVFKANLVEEFNLAGVPRSCDRLGVQEVRLMRWQTVLEQGLIALDRNITEASEQAKSASWKLALAAWMKTKTQASNRWLSSKLNLGTPTSLSHNLTNYRRLLQSKDPAWSRLIALNLA